MRTIVIFSGRFQPAHLGHLSVYSYLCQRFGSENVFVATTDKTVPTTSPFSFADKVQMWTRLGVPASHVVQVRSPYNPVEITSEVPEPEHTALVMAVSAKDMEGDDARFRFGTKKDGSPSYLQPLPADTEHLAPMDEHAYVLTVPTQSFRLGNTSATSATQIRTAYMDGNDDDRRAIIHDLYGEDDPALKQTFDRRLNITETALRLAEGARQQLKEGRPSRRVFQLMEKWVRQEREVDGTPFVEELVQNYWRER